jgi:hypothetical protein
MGVIHEDTLSIASRILAVTGPFWITPGSVAGASAQLLLVTLFSQPLLTLVRRHLVALALFAAGHAASFLRLRGK